MPDTEWAAAPFHPFFARALKGWNFRWGEGGRVKILFFFRPSQIYSLSLFSTLRHPSTVLPPKPGSEGGVVQNVGALISYDCALQAIKFNEQKWVPARLFALSFARQATYHVGEVFLGFFATVIIDNQEYLKKDAG